MIVQRLLPFLLLWTFFQQAPVPPAAPPAPSVFRISGRVIDAITGQPLARASVVINPTNFPNTPNPPDSARVEITDEQGLFAFAAVAPGKYVLSARHRGYLAQMYQQHENFMTAIVVGPGLQSENLIFGLRPGASISGKVVDESDDSIRQAEVMLFQQMFVGGRHRTIQMRNARTNDEGHYQFGHLNPGTYFVGVSAQPWYAQHARSVHVFTKLANGPTTQDTLQPVAEQNQSLDVVYPIAFFSNGTDLSNATSIRLHSGDAAIADFRMRPVPSAHLLVRTPVMDDGQVTGISVSQTFADSRTIWIPAQVHQVAPGLMEITGVPQGRFNLNLDTHRGGASARRSQSVQVENDVEVDVTRSGSSVVVSGILRIEDGSPTPQPARVELLTSATSEVFVTTVSAAGEFSFKDNPVEPGNYELRIIEPQALFIRSLTSPNVKTSGRSFEIATAQDVTVTINASKGNGRITGVALKKDKPVGGEMIVLAPLDLKSNPALFRRDQSDSDGTFTLNAVVPGRYTLMAIEDGWDLEWGNPDVLKKYLARGESVEIAPHQKSDVKVNVQ